jgi:tetratricopeptide (TPR) repeat protein
VTEQEALAALRGDDAAAAARAEAALWEMWCRSGDAAIDHLLRQGVERMERREFLEAEIFFTQIVTKAPAFAEGWNKRATVRYLAENYEGAIADCRETLARNPHHFGALSGQGLCHVALGQHREAVDCFRRALAIHPRLMNARGNLVSAMGEAVRGNGHA